MTEPNQLENKRVIVVGGSRGLGRGMADAMATAGAEVTVVARNPDDPGKSVTRRGDATDPAFAANLLTEIDPDIVVVVAGATPAMRPLSRYSWEAFSACWETDVKASFYWLQDCLARPMRSGGRVVVVSSGAARVGSPLSGGYAGAKQTQRFMCQYARGEASERELGINVQCLMPQLNPNTALGASGVRAYAARAGMDPEAFVRERFGTPLSPEIAGESLLALLTSPEHVNTPEFMLTGKGLHPVHAS